MQYANKASTTWKTELERIEAGGRKERAGGEGGDGTSKGNGEREGGIGEEIGRGIGR